jgi:hypothetical protein
MRRLLLPVLLLGLLAPAAAGAQASESEEGPREIVHGLYAKAHVGYQLWVGTPYVSYGPQFMFGAGYDFLDQLSYTVSAEANLLMGTINGISGSQAGVPGDSPVQGDFQSIGGIVAVRGAYNLGGTEIKRLSLYARAGGGVWYSPEARGAEDDDNPINGITLQTPHGAPKPTIAGALGAEYFTRLAHFSLGIEAQMLGIIARTNVTGGNFSPALDINLLLKYTFGKANKS